MQQIQIKISGLVQGVFFRMHTQKKAKSLGLTGAVKNTDDGGVEVIAEGEKTALEQLIAWCRQGPPSARVDKVETVWSQAKGKFSDFKISHF
ncbi:MAG: acylphosphatase [Pseudomonadota bacterium]